MEKGKDKDGRKRPQQRPEDPVKHNAQQEREYREQKHGKDEHIKDRVTKEEAIDEYADMEDDKVKKKKEEE